MTTRSWAAGTRVRKGWWCIAMAACAAAGPAFAQPVGPFPVPTSARRYDKAPLDRFLPVRIAWTAGLSAAASGRPALDDRHVYVAMRDGTLSAFSLAAGSVAWTVRTESAMPPVCARHLVLVIGADVVEARSPEDGSVRWRTPLASAPGAPGTVVGTRLVLGLQSGDLVILDVDSGRTEWSRNVGARLSADPAGDDARLLVGLADGQVVAVHPASGEPLWTFRTAGAVTGLALDGDRAYAGSKDNVFYSLSAETGRLSWKWRTGGDIVGKPAFDRDRVYVASLDNLLRALDRGNGSQQWKRALRSRPLGGPSVVGEAVMVPGFAPEIRTNWTKDGRPVDRVATEAELATPFTVLERAWPKPGGLAVVTSAGQLVLFVERIDPELQPFRMPVGIEAPLTAPSDLP